MADRRVSIGRLKARLSEYLSLARAGEVVIVTDRGTPVARLAPLEGATALEGRAAELERAGAIGRPRRRLSSAFLAAPRPSDPAGRSLDMVLEERAEGW